MRAPDPILLALAALVALPSLSCRSKAPATVHQTNLPPLKGRFVLASPMHRSRRSPQVVALADGRVLIASSLEADRVRTHVPPDPDPDCTELYDSRSGAFYPLPPLPERVAGAEACLLQDGSVVFLGGVDPKEERAVATLLRYDPDTGTYETLSGGLVHPRTGHRTLLLEDGRVLVVGGRERSGKAVLDCEFYDPRTRNCRTGPRLIQERTGGFVAVRLLDGRVLVAGGEGGVASAEVLGPKSSAWKRLPDLGVGRDRATAVLLADGRVLIAGGSRQEGGRRAYESSAECFLPGKDLFRSTGTQLATARGSAAGILLPDRRVLVVGGNDATRTFGSTEYFNPETLDFSPGPSMFHLRLGPCLAPLGNGQVLVVGPNGSTAEVLE